MDRRTFLKSTAAASAAVLWRPSFAEAALPQAKITRIRFYEAPNVMPLQIPLLQSNMVVTIETDANIIMGNYQRPQPGNKGHFHEEGGEFWLICLGTIRYNIEGLAEFEAQEGDVVYVPRQTWHLASNGGKEGLRSCRLAMNGFPYQAHMFEQN